jgi:hypothetical protein
MNQVGALARFASAGAWELTTTLDAVRAMLVERNRLRERIRLFDVSDPVALLGDVKHF